MRKIPTLFIRDPQDRAHVTSEVNPECQWVLDGEGIATRKYDGTCVMLDEDGNWWARREVKLGKASPPFWLFVDGDRVTGKSVGWEPIGQSPFAKFHAEAVANKDIHPFKPGTYELCGPRINGNPEGWTRHRLASHADAETFGVTGVPRLGPDLVALVRALGNQGWEGVVWHHPDGRMAKLKSHDFPGEE